MGRSFQLFRKYRTGFLVPSLLLACRVEAGHLLVGAGFGDTTGTMVGRGMDGYADLGQVTAGIHTRLSSRAFVIEDPDMDRRVALVSVDLAMIQTPIKREVIARLNAAFPGRFSEENVMLMATHTHSGPGGYSHYDLFNVTTLGFDSGNFSVIVRGIFESIRQAYANRVSGKILYNEGEIRGIAKNRSITAYRNNKDWQQYDGETDLSTPLLRFVADDGREVGVFNWFAVHPVSMSKHNRLISSDNSGVAAQLFEKEMSQGIQARRFIAAFANGNEGDASPNVFSSSDTRSDFQKSEYIGTRRYEKVRELFETAATEVSPEIEYRHVWVDMPKFRVSGKRLCPAAVGYSFAAGAEDGPSDLPGYHEGMRQGDNFAAIFPINSAVFLLGALIGGARNGEECQYPKPVFLSSSPFSNDLFPGTLPVQMIRIGEIVIAGVPAEFTTMSGRRTKKDLLDMLAPIGVKHVVLGGLANDYSGYVATPEEFELQHYEGAFTLFGPHTLEAYRTVFKTIAQSLIDQKEVSIDPAPQPRTRPLLDWLPSTTPDTRKLNESFGSVLASPHPRYTRGQVVQVQFRGANLRNTLGVLTNLMSVDYWDGIRWVRVADDSDLDTFVKWSQDYSVGCLNCSTISIDWDTRAVKKAGIYRISHFGYRKDWSGKLAPYRGTSPTFEVR